MKHCIFSILLVCLGLTTSHAQVILTPISAPETMVACGSAERFTLSVINAGSMGFSNLPLQIILPPGMEYVPGSLQGPFTEANLGNLSSPQFNYPSLPALSTQQISIACIINCAFTNSSGPRYLLTLPSGVQQAQEQPLANYFFPEVVITNVDAPVLNLAVAASGQRTFTVIQSTPGAILDTLFFINRYDPGMESLGLNIGSLFGSSPGIDTFMLTGADMPGGDNGFNAGDTLFLTETVRLLDCAPANSVIELFWRCGSVVCQSFISNTILTQATGSPDLRITNTNGFANQVAANTPSIVGGGFCDTLRLSYLLENLGGEDAPGAGAVYDLVLGMGLNNNLFSSTLPFDLSIFPNWTILVEMGGVLLDLGNYQFPNPNPLRGYNLDFRQMISDPDGPGGLRDIDNDGFFDDLPVGSSTTLEVLIIYDPDATSGCAFLSGYPYNGGAETIFRLGYQYQDQCSQPRAYWYSVNDVGTNIVSLFTHRSIIYTVTLAENNLSQGQVTTMEIRPDGAWNSPCGATDSFILEIILPDGLVAEPSAYGPGDFSGIVGQSGDTIWLASNERGTYTQPWGLNVSMDCNETIVDTTLNISFLYFCDSDCGPMKRINCQEIVLDYLPQCETCLEGVETRGFAAERISMGWTNSAHTQQVDPDTDPSINTGAAINRDSVALTLNGILRGSGPFDALNVRLVYQGIDAAFADPTLPHFAPIGATFDYFAQDGSVYSCVDPPFLTNFDPGNGEHTITAQLESFFQAGGCLQNVTRMAGDSMVLRIFTRVTENTPRRAVPVPELKGQFFLLQNGQRISCNEYLDNFILEQVIPNASLVYSSQEHYGCAAIYFNNNAITNPGHIYDADQFPNEVRSIVDVSEVRMILEGNWEHQSGSSDLLANGSFDENDGIAAGAPFVTIPLPDPLISFDGAYTTFTYVNPGTWPKGDLVIGGSNPVHNIRFRAIPGCLVPNDTPFEIQMEADMIRYLNAPVEWRDTITSRDTSSNKTYLGPRANLLLASPQEFIPNSDTVRWEVNINNNTSYGHPDKLLQHVWLALEQAGAVAIFAIEDITDPANPIAFPWQTYDAGGSYWIQIGQVAAFATRRFRISGLYTDCARQELLLRMGYSCLDYPNPHPGAGYQLAGTFFQCADKELALYIQPTPVSLNLNVEGPPLPAPLCEPLDYSIVVSNVNLPAAYEHEMRTQLPLGAEIIPGTSTIEIPANSGNWFNLADPIALGNNTFSWPLSNDPNGLAILPGVNQAPANTYRLSFKLLTRCGLNAGLRIGFSTEASNSCGALEERTAFSERLLIQGLPETANNYALFLGTPEGGLQACDTTQINAKLINLGPFPSRDIEFAIITLPAAFDLLPGTNPPTVALTSNTTIEDRRFLRFQMPAGVPPGDSIVLPFSLTDLRNTELDCEAAELSLAAVLEAQVACGLSPTDSCAILLVLNSDTITTAVLKDELDFVITEHRSLPLGQTGETLTTLLRLQNLQNAPARTDSIIWEVYVDDDLSGTISPGDELLYGSLPRPITLAANASWLDSITYTATTDQVCQLLVTYRNSGFSCACDPPLVYVLPNPILANAGPDQLLCSDESIWLGTDERLNGMTFEWSALGSSPLGAITPLDSSFTLFQWPNSSLTAQTYSFQLETQRGPNCVSRDTVQITVLPELRSTTSVASDYNGQAISCAGAADGALAVSTTLGQMPLTYELNGQVQDNPIFTDLTAGSYQFMITDANGCTSIAEGMLDQPDSLMLDAQLQSTSCANTADGSIQIQVNGGTPGYSYSWSGGLPNAAQQNNLPAGPYQLSLTDANNCLLVSDTLWLDRPPAISYELSIDATSCSYSSDGSVQISNLSGGTGSLSLLWPDGTSSLTNANLPIGEANLTITDENDCLTLIPYFVPGPAPLVVNSLEQENVSCFGLADGQIAVSVMGGTGPYQYQWAHGPDAPTLTNLLAGSYEVLVTDAQNCNLLVPDLMIEQPSALSIDNFEIEGISCFGFADGQISVEAGGGTPPYRYAWENGTINPTLAGLEAGSYTLELTDDNDCFFTTSYTVPQPPPLTNVLERLDPACSGEEGTFTFFPDGGTPPYVFSADGGQTFTEDASIDAGPGTYLLVIRDQNGCLFTDEAEMMEPLPLFLDAPEQIILDYGDSITLFIPLYNVRGDTFIQWLPATSQLSCDDCLNPTIYAQETTVFYLRVRDSFGCAASARIPMIVEFPRRVYLPNAFSPNGVGDNEVWYPFAANEVALIRRLEVFNRWGGQVFSQKNFPPNDPLFGWDGWFNGSPAPSAVYVYFVEVEFTDGTVLVLKGDVVLVR
ncbi:gliding motility-associated C-terminal domain-containing protein [Lewinella sp. LCG006]|uniref:T9SS type B sorting domain-containing protein n=1 Tax=Lewinella sp. LCG006 TaxID=3231911 RepID=UPI00345FC3FB